MAQWQWRQVRYPGSDHLEYVVDDPFRVCVEYGWWQWRVTCSDLGMFAHSLPGVNERHQVEDAKLLAQIFVTTRMQVLASVFGKVG